MLQLVLAHVWRDDGWRVLRAAGEAAGVDKDHPLARARMVGRFRRADYRYPVLPEFRAQVAVDRLPERFTAWRGGNVEPAEVAEGVGRSRDRGFACHFGRMRWRRGWGPPVVLRREIRREEVLCWPTNHGPRFGPEWDPSVTPIGDDVVAPGAGPWVVDTADADGIEAAAEELEPRLQASLRDLERHAAAQRGDLAGHLAGPRAGSAAARGP